MSLAKFRISSWPIALMAALACGTVRAETSPNTDTHVGIPPSYLLAPIGAVPLPTASSDSRPITAPRLIFAGQSSSRARLVEIPREHVPGQYSRPRYALGFRSDSMKSWLNDRGFPASVCMAPLVRLRSKLSTDGDWSGSVMLQARCSFF